MTKVKTNVKRSGAILALLIGLAALLAAPAFASFKWIQEPDLEETGVSVEVTLNYIDAMYILADDWECQEIGPITEIQIWCAWAHDEPPMMDPNNVEFVLVIHEDIPAEDNPDGYSTPGEALWVEHFGPGQFIVHEGMSATKGWLTPPNQYWYPCCDMVYSYIFDIQEGAAFVQQGTPGDPKVYWLSVQAHPMVEDDKYIGWLTSTDHWNDNAVVGGGLQPCAGPWAELFYPTEHVWAGQDIDLAFAVGGPGFGVRFDFGDAPDPTYPTLLASDGARHRDIEGGPRLGFEIDFEADGIPTSGAWGDDDSNIDDEDGLVFMTPFWVGEMAEITVETITGGLLDAFADFNCDGDWDDPEEHFAHSQMLFAGVNVVELPIPPYAVVGESAFIRLRISSQGGLTSRGLAEDGEVEDYETAWENEIPIEYDFGDAPDPSYPTLLASDGARHDHGYMSPMLGSYLDREFDGQPDPAAEGDDNDGLDDEDGVSLPASFVPGMGAQIEVTVSMDCLLDAWIDWNDDGDWDDNAEQIAMSRPMFAGANLFWVITALDAPPGATTYARFRVSEDGGLGYTGLVQGGEVEDYSVFISGETGVDETVPQSYGLHQNVPNPFNPTTTIHYDVPGDGARVSLRIFDVMGQRVRTLLDGTSPAGSHGIVWNGRADDGRSLPSGVYFYRFETEGYVKTRKMLMLQ